MIVYYRVEVLYIRGMLSPWAARHSIYRVWTDCATLTSALEVQQIQEYVVGRPARIVTHEIVI